MVAVTGIAIELQDRTKQSARSVERSLKGIKKAAKETAVETDKLTSEFDGLKDEFKKTGTSANKTAKAFKNFDEQQRKLKKNTNDLQGNVNKLRAAFGLLATSVIVKQFGDLLDVSTQINNRLKLVTDGTFALGLAQEQLFKVSQDSRVGFEQTADLYARLARSTEDLGLTQKELVDVTETISQAITISGASAESANAALIQLGQGIASGTLRGDELNSVLEQTPRLAEAIADGIGVGIGQLRELGSEGKITSETIITAIQSQQGAVRTEFGQTSATLGQSFTTINNSLTRFVLELDKASKISETLAGVLIQASEAIDELTNEKSQTRANISAIDTLLTDIPLFELSRIFTVASNPNVADIDVNATTDPVTLIFRALNDLFFEESEKSTNLLEEYITTIEKEQETRKQAQQDFNRLTFELEQEFIELDRATANGLDDILDTIGQKVDDLDLLPSRFIAAGYQPRGNRIGDPTRPNFKKFEVDESVLGFADVVAEVDAVINDLNGGFDGLLEILSKTNPELSKTVGSFRNIFSSAVQGDYITATANYFVLLSDVLFDTGNESDKLAQRMRILSEELKRANVAAGEATTARLANLPQFAEVRESLLKPFEDLYDIIRERTFEPQNLANIADFYQIDLEQAEIQAEIETLDQFFRSIVGGFTGISEEFQRALQMSGITEENISQYQMRIRDIFFGGGNNEIVFEELGRAALAAKDEFQGLSDSLNNSAREARNLNTAEQAVTRLRVNAQEIALRTQLSEAFKLAGGDVFEQRAAYQRFERQLKGLQYGTGGGGGQTASTGSAKTSAAGATQSTSVDTTIDADVSINKASITTADLFNLPTSLDWQNFWKINLFNIAATGLYGPSKSAEDIVLVTKNNKATISTEDLFNIPTSNEWENYWSLNLLGRADSDEVGPDNAALQVIANTFANRRRIYPSTMFIVPEINEWENYWSQFLLGRADNNSVGPDNVAQQVVTNTFANRRRIYPSTMFVVPEVNEWENYWSTSLLNRADNNSVGPDNVALQVVRNTFANRKRIYPSTMFIVPQEGEWSGYWSAGLLARADNSRVGPDNVAQQIIFNTIRNRKRIYPSFMFIIPSNGDWSSYWSRGLLARADNSRVGPDNVAQQIVENTKANKKTIRTYDMFNVPSSGQWRSYWSANLLGRADNSRTGPDNVAQQVLVNTIANKKEILPSHMFKIPDALDFLFFFGDMVADFRTGLNAAFTNIPSVELNIVDLLNFNASGISEAINDAVKEAIRDRSYDEAGRLGFRSGRQ